MGREMEPAESVENVGAIRTSTLIRQQTSVPVTIAGELLPKSQRTEVSVFFNLAFPVPPEETISN